MICSGCFDDVSYMASLVIKGWKLYSVGSMKNFLSFICLICISSQILSENHGCCDSFTFCVFSGVCLFMAAGIPLLYVSTISDNIVCSFGMSSDDRFSRMSSRKRSLLMSLNFLYLISLVVSLLCCTSIVESMMVWSDNIYPLVTDFMDVSSWLLISKSKVCPDLCFGH